MDDQGGENNTIREVKSNSFSSVFMDADYIDVLLMTVGLFGSIADGVTTPVMLVITSKIMNSLGSGFGDDPDVVLRAITKSCIAFLYLACGIFLACFLEAYCWTRTGERQASRMRHKYLKAVLRQDVGYFDLKGSNTSVVVTSVTNDTLLIQDVIGEKIPHFLANTSTLIGSQIIAFVLLWRIAIVGLPFVLILVAPGLVYGRILMGLTAKLREEYGKASSIVEETISSVRTVYSFVGENKTMKKFSVALQGPLKLGLKQGLVKGLAIGSHGVSFVVWAFLSWYGSRLVMYHGSDGGDVFAAGASIAVGGIAFGQGLASMKMIFKAYTAAVRMREVIKRVPEIDTDNLEGEILQSVSGEVEFKNIKFAYPSRPESMVLENFNLIVPAGKTVALVGGSGSGKSTVIALLERFYNPDHGEILFDGVAISKLQIKWLRSQMGLVSQEPALFATSIKENILFGKEDATIDEVIEAAKHANAHDFISQFPQGYDTQVGERGVQMSGGQKQRIAIARAIIKAPRILLLDEATSALDSESERIVQEALDNASVGRTTIVIAHRLSTICNADLIVVVRDGKVMESGSHEKLFQDKNGLYSSLVRMQQMEKTEGEDNSRTILRSSSHHLHSRSAKVVRRTRSASSVPQGQATSVEENKEKHIPVPVPVPSLKRLLLLNAPEWKHACVGYTSAAFYGAVQPVFAYVLGSLISIYFLTDHDEIKSKSREYALYFFGLGVFSMIISLCQHYSFAVMGEYLTTRIRERMLSKILTFEVGWFDQDENSSGAVCSRLDKDASAVRSLVGDRMSLLIQTFSAVALACTLGMIIAWRLALVMTAVQPLIIVCYYQRNVLLKNLSSKAKASQDESSKLAAEAVSNLRTISAFSSQARILGLFDQAQDGPRRDSIYQSWFAGLGLGLAQSLTSCTWALDYWYGGKLVSQEHITAKELFQTFMILVSTGIVIANAGSMTSDLAKGSDAVASFFAVLDRYTRIEPEDKEGSQPEKMIGNIEFDNIHFSYPARPNVIIFKGFSISIEAGNSTALVGQSGSGKSSIISLIERFYDPLKGTISIDGRDIKSYHLRSLRKHIALVSQEPSLFGGTIRQNIEYGSSDKVNEAEIINAARSANAHDFITALKDGYDTWCGERGLQLSGGQKQRIAIARAILKNPAILLLDEATSALDSKSENVVQQALDRVMVGRTSVVVAHRLSTIQKCDLIAVLEKGNVVEKGTHLSLMGKGSTGAYYGLVSIQQRKTDTNDI